MSTPHSPAKTRKRPAAARTPHRTPATAARGQRTSRSHRAHPARRTTHAAAHNGGSLAAHELELFLRLLKKCKRAVGSFTDEQKDHLRSIMSKAHKAIDSLHG